MKTTSRISVTQSGAGLARLSQLDIAVARHARSHDDHASPIVGCYLCLHGVVRFERDSAPLPDDTSGRPRPRVRGRSGRPVCGMGYARLEIAESARRRRAWSPLTNARSRAQCPRAGPQENA